MPVYNIRGVDIDFPHEAYPQQLVYMEKVIQGAQEKKHAMLESPTGTGKTLCLLCATTSWRADRKKRDSGQQGAPPLGKIVYSSRTHSQISQVVKELKRTAAAGTVKTTVLGSRNQLCVHPEVSKLSASAQQHACQQLVKNQGCKYYKGVRPTMQKNPEFHKEVRDIEDLVSFGKSSCVCPYYLSRQATESADIVFLPYNYLVDGKMQDQLNLVENNLVIFDEAHNVDAQCCEASSIDFTPDIWRSCVKEIEFAQRLSERELLTAQKMAEKSRETEVKRETGQFKFLLSCLNKLAKNLNQKGAMKQAEAGSVLSAMLGEAGVSISNKATITGAIDAVQLKIAPHQDFNNSGNESETNRTSPLHEFGQLIQRAFLTHAELKKYRVMLTADRESSRANDKAQKSFKNDVPRENEPRYTLSLWCLSPGVAMQRIIEQKPNNIILTSGTLSPMDTLEMELGVKFQIQLESTHVINPNQQVWAGVLGTGPLNRILNSSFQNRDSEEYKQELGGALANLARIVPDGMLVFFPSYGVMNSCLQSWRHATPGKESVWDRMHKFKEVVVEPRSQSELQDAMRAFTYKVESSRNGAMLLAVCRGKVSEGIDFADKHGRAVVLTGLPYPPKGDPKVLAKQRYMDETFSKSSGGQLSGQTWYVQQATRAVNQAIGRVIRHKDDYGAVLLCDQRFRPDGLSSWIRPHVKNATSFGATTAQLVGFYKRAAARFSPEDAKQDTKAQPGSKPKAGQNAHKRKFSASSAAATKDAPEKRRMPIDIEYEAPTLAPAAPMIPFRQLVAKTHTQDQIQAKASVPSGISLAPRTSRHLLYGGFKPAQQPQAAPKAVSKPKIVKTAQDRQQTRTQPVAEAPKVDRGAILKDAKRLLNAANYQDFRKTLEMWKKSEINEKQLIDKLLGVFLEVPCVEFARQFNVFIPRDHRSQYLQLIDQFERKENIQL